MKAVITIVFSLVASTVLAQEVIIAKNANIALKSCQEKSKSSPKELQEQMLKSCECIVNHTDFTKANELNSQGKDEELIMLYDEALSNCSKQNSRLINIVI